jgi:lysophospholipase L1-like esterase
MSAGHQALQQQPAVWFPRQNSACLFTLALLMLALLRSAGGPTARGGDVLAQESIAASTMWPRSLSSASASESSSISGGGGGGGGGRRPRLFVLGSSVASGSGATSASRSWVGRIAAALGDCADVINRAEGGMNTASLIDKAASNLAASRTHGLPAAGPGDVVVVALSLANEGLPWTSSKPNADGLADVYLANLRHVALLIERRGATPVIAGVYPFDGYTPMHRSVLTRVNEELQSWGEAAARSAPDRTPYALAINFLPAVDDGQGHWRKGLQVDEGHPNDAGHVAMVTAIDMEALRTLLLRPPQTSSPPPPPLVRAEPQRRVLAYGDSLTAGFHNGGRSLSPWAPVLARLLGARVDYSAGSGITASQMSVDVDSESLPDVCGEFYSGLRCLVSSPHVR